VTERNSVKSVDHRPKHVSRFAPAYHVAPTANPPLSRFFAKRSSKEPRNLSKGSMEGATSEDGSAVQLRIIPHQRIDVIAASEASVAVCSGNSVEIEFDEKGKREPLNGEACASPYRITAGKRKLCGLSIALSTIYLKASDLFPYKS
jgi:hypothetical protein